MRYDVSDIYLKESIFTDGGFFDAVATYVHESCHAFGGDSSESFSLALTHAMEMLLARPELVADYERQWHGVFAAQEAPAPQTTPALQAT